MHSTVVSWPGPPPSALSSNSGFRGRTHGRRMGLNGTSSNPQHIHCLQPHRHPPLTPGGCPTRQTPSRYRRPCETLRDRLCISNRVSLLKRIKETGTAFKWRKSESACGCFDGILSARISGMIGRMMRVRLRISCRSAGNTRSYAVHVSAW